MEGEILEKRNLLERQHLLQVKTELEKNLRSKEEAIQDAKDRAKKEAEEQEEARGREQVRERATDVFDYFGIDKLTHPRLPQLEKIKAENDAYSKLGREELEAKKISQKKKLLERRKLLKKKKDAEKLKLKQAEERLNLKLEQEEQLAMSNLARSLESELTGNGSADKELDGLRPWEVKLVLAMREAKKDSSSDEAWESAIIAEISDGELVPEIFVAEGIQRVLGDRHGRETTAMLSGQYRERSCLLRLALNDVFDKKSETRKKILVEERGEEARQEKLRLLDEEFAGRKERAEEDVGRRVDEQHAKMQQTLRGRQLGEIREAILAVGNKSEEEVTERSEARRSEARRSEAKRGEAKRGEAKRGEAKRGEAKRGEAKRGEAKRGEARRSEARRSEARRSEAKRSEARRSEARRGEAKRALMKTRILEYSRWVETKLLMAADKRLLRSLLN